MPKIPQPDVWLWEAFCHLSEKRWRYEGGPQPIPVSEIAAYAAYHSIERDGPRGLFFYMMSCLDSHYMRHQRAEKAAKDAKTRHQ